MASSQGDGEPRHGIGGRLGVAQGTFYYHFASKQDLLDAIIERLVAPLVSHLAAIVDDNGAGPRTKLRRFLEALFLAMRVNRELVEHLKRPENDLMHSRFGELLTARLLPLLRTIVDEGLRFERFDIDLPVETTEVLLAALTHLTRVHGDDLDDERLERLRKATETLYLRAFGAATE